MVLFWRGLSPNLKGAVWMLGSAVTFTAYLATAKVLSARYDPGLIAFWRTALATLLALPWMLGAGASFWRLSRPWMVIARSAAGSLGFLLSLIAVAGLPISQMNALSFARPLFIVILAVIWLREAVGPRRWTATAIGFVGVLILVAPPDGDWGGLNLASLAALAAAAAFAVSIVLVKSLTRDHSEVQLIVWANLISMLFTVPFALMHWQLPQGAGDWVLMLAMGLSGLAAQSCYVRGLAVGEASFVSAMDYLRLPMTALVDWIVFRSVPGPGLWLGAGLIIGSSLYIVWREQKLARLGARRREF